MPSLPEVVNPRVDKFILQGVFCDLIVDGGPHLVLIVLLELVAVEAAAALLRHLCQFDDVIGWVLVLADIAAELEEVRRQVTGEALVDLAAVLQDKQSIEKGKLIAAGRVDRGNYGHAVVCLSLEHVDDPVGSRGVQAGRWLIE